MPGIPVGFLGHLGTVFVYFGNLLIALSNLF
jgi:hypothetical protein